MARKKRVSVSEARANLLAQQEQSPGSISRYNARAARLTAITRRNRAALPTDKWIILTCAGQSTLRLARLLAEDGIQAWSPSGSIERKRSYGRGKIEVALPIVPSVVFAGASFLSELVHVSRLAISPYPAFTIFSTERGVPIVENRALMALLAEAMRQQAEAAARLQIAADRAERARLAKAKTAEQIRVDEERRARRAVKKVFPQGQRVTVDDPLFTGKVGIVEACDGHQVSISFGGPATIEIGAWLVFPEPI